MQGQIEDIHRVREYERTVLVEDGDDDRSDPVLLHDCEDTHGERQAAGRQHRLLRAVP
jgi:hypothetical protein